MSRLLATLVILIVVLVGGLFLLAGRAHERPTAPVEKPVSLANLT